MPLRIGKKKKRQSFCSDRLIKDHSITHCPCDLYCPEPSVKLDEFGAIKEVCVSGETLQWSKHCILHICEVAGLSPSSQFMFDDTGQDCEICLSAVLSPKKGDFSYQIRDKFWHEFSHKSGDIWRHFFFKFDEEEEEKYWELEDKIKNILLLVNSVEGSKIKKTYILLAVQTNLEKRKSTLSHNRNSRLSLYNLNFIGEGTITPPHSEQSLSSDENSPVKEDRKSPDHFSLTDPFDLADWSPHGHEKEENKENKFVNDSIHDSAVSKSINYLCDSLHIHPNELPQRLESILRSAQVNSEEKKRKQSRHSDIITDFCISEDKKSGPFVQGDNIPDGKLVVNTFQKNESAERLASEFLQTEELYIPMGFVAGDNKKAYQKEEENRTGMAQHGQANPRLHRAQEVAQLLQTAINNTDLARAEDYARQLAGDENVTVTIDVKLRTHIPNERDKDFDLKVNIEDKESSGGTITLKVKASDTIRDLKNMMLRKHMFPLEVQYWIIGKRIPQDNETLDKCKIKTHGFTAFLYLISAKAAGINKEDFMRQNMPHKADLAMSHTPKTPAPNPEMIPTHGRLGSSATPQSGATSSASTGKPRMEPQTLDPNINISGRNEKRTPEKLPVAQGSRVKYEHNAVQQSAEEIVHGLAAIEPQLGAYMEHINDTPYGESRQRVPVMHPEENEEPQQGWACPACTYINQPTRPGCEVCASDRPADYEIPSDYQLTEEERNRMELDALIERKTREEAEKERILREREQLKNFAYLREVDEQDLIPNREAFTCSICFDDYDAGEGVVLRECLHSFCKDCLKDAILYNEEPELKCPFVDADYMCCATLQEREIKALVGQAGFAKYLARGLATAESQAQNSFHCKTADCPGWCIYEDHVNFFVCQVCGKENCLTCKVIHQGMNCKQYQEDLKARAVNDKAASQTQIMIKRMLDDGDAMNCPQCRVIVMKKEGCDWIQCSICKTEICWVTKGPRWGPGGNGDTSGGCRCRVNGEVCHPDCNNCH